MKDSAQLQQQLRSLSIPKEQRPRGTPAGSAGKRRTILTTVIVLLAVGGVWLGWAVFGSRLSSSDTASADEIQVLQVVVRDRPEQTPVLTATGKIVSDHRVEVATKVSGQVVALYFEQGDRIERGQLLARIEDVTYRARRDEAAALLAKAKADLEYQKINFERVSKLHEEQQAPDIEYAEAKKQLGETQAQVAADEAALAAMEKMLIDCEVLAPIAGVVLERSVEVGDFVAAEGGRGAMANSQFAAIADMEKLRVEIDVSELDVNRLRAGMPCVVIPDAYKDRKYTGHVMWIDPGANYAKATVQVKVRIDDPDDRLRVEGAAQVQFFNSERAPDPRAPDLGRGLPATTEADRPLGAAEPATSRPAPAIWIPAAACRLDPSGSTAKVFVVNDGRLRETSVRIGRRESNSLEVLDGLTVGQTIAADAQKARDGRRVP